MKLNTKGFGEIEISEKQKINFKNGLFGFEDVRDFVLLDSTDESPFYWLQSEKFIETAFVLVNPFEVDSNYQVKIDDADRDDLEIKNEEDVLVFTIVTIYKKVEDITINLLGPVIINKNNRKAKQIINQYGDYNVKHPLLMMKEGKC